MAGIASLEQLLGLLRGQGVRTVYVKHLSPRQDNEKNQIYLGQGLDGVTNLFPARIEVRSASQSLTKPKSAAGRAKLEAVLEFAWLDTNGVRHDAPHTRIIDYFQYPEVRMSGFLKGCGTGPDALRREKLAHYGKRSLVMGTAADGKVVGLVLTHRHDALVVSFPDLPLAGTAGVLRVLSVDGMPGTDPAELLKAEISAIIRAGWHSSRINKGGTIVPFTGGQGGGYTLEALLGVAANGNKMPDRHGFEIKSYSGSRISLMTPTPDGLRARANAYDLMSHGSTFRTDPDDPARAGRVHSELLPEVSRRKFRCLLAGRPIRRHPSYSGSAKHTCIHGRQDSPHCVS